MGLLSELKLAVPWGHIAAKAWGSLKGPPVLCLHGWLDNANSFNRLIPLLPQDFYYVAMDFGGHGLSSHLSPGFPYYSQDFVCQIRRVAAALKWNRFSLMGHSFGGTEMEHLLTYRRKAMEHTLQVEAATKPSSVVSPEEMLQRFLKNNPHVGEECGKLLLERGTTQVATGLMLNRDRRITLPEHCFDFISRELFAHAIRKLQAHVLHIKALQGFYNVRRVNDSDKETMLFLIGVLKSVLKEQYQFVEVPGNHYIHMNKAHHVAPIISAFLQSQESPGS
ncbi:serine hydrolase-like protein 2 isoform X2 [Choloepus didactylus]|uniref:serine hydrolase-like protein 2 isoform X2 n=1 Tax=Choloepus didactylus TaxID=27675 RepID=UPI00189DA07E|nr:serine hydrolase-like protein 2 isoform X2 [Choloepus didactylus]